MQFRGSSFVVRPRKLVCIQAASQASCSAASARNFVEPDATSKPSGISDSTAHGSAQAHAQPDFWELSWEQLMPWRPQLGTAPAVASSTAPGFIGLQEQTQPPNPVASLPRPPEPPPPPPLPPPPPPLPTPTPPLHLPIGHALQSVPWRSRRNPLAPSLVPKSFFAPCQSSPPPPQPSPPEARPSTTKRHLRHLLHLRTLPPPSEPPTKRARPTKKPVDSGTHGSESPDRQ